MCYHKNGVKKRSILISILILLFSMVFLLISSGAKAESKDDSKKDLVTILHIKAASLVGQDNDSDGQKDRGKESLRGIRVHVKEGLNAFFDFSSPAHQGLAQKDSRTDLRGVFGFRILLK